MLAPVRYLRFLCHLLGFGRVVNARVAIRRQHGVSNQRMWFTAGSAQRILTLRWSTRMSEDPLSAAFRQLNEF